MSTHELFQKHFGNTAAVDMKHPNMESFFEELNVECLAEDKQKNCNIPDVVGRSEQLVCRSCSKDDMAVICTKCRKTLIESKNTN